ncbi:MAG: Arc-like binding domain [Pseudomonadota bacterium]|jgi:hypothetical protein
MTEKKRQNAYPVRLEPEISEWIKAKAKQEDRSINAEINRQLRKAKEADTQATDTAA